MQLLIRRPTPRHGESLRGYALRIDSENSVNLFRSRMSSFKEACMALMDMEAATGKSLRTLRQMACVTHRNGNAAVHINVFGIFLPRAWVATQVKRLCPQCLQESGYMHALWEVHVIKTCPAHKCHLIDQCQFCRKYLSWHQGGLFHCRCGESLLGMRGTPAGGMRADLDLLMSESLHPTLEGRIDLWQSGLLNLLSPPDSGKFYEYAVIAGHIVPRIGYAIAHESSESNDEQQSEFAMRLIRLGRPGIEAALFSALGNEMQAMTPRRRCQLLRRGAQGRNEILQLGFNLNSDLQRLDFVRHVLYPAWEQAHHRWSANVMRSLTEVEAQKSQRKTEVRIKAMHERMNIRAKLRAELQRERELESQAKYSVWKERKIASIAKQLFNEREFYESVLTAYRDNPSFAELRYRQYWIWFKDRLEKWEP